MDNFHTYLKTQLVEYVESERSKGVPLEEIEKVLMNAGHKKNIIDEVLDEIKKEHTTGKETKHKDPVENDLVSQLKTGFLQFMAKATNKEIKEAKVDIEKTDTQELVEEVIDEVEIIEEKTMLESFVFFAYLVVLGLIILFSTGASGSSLIRVILGYLAAILSVFISFTMLSFADNVPLYMMIPLAFATIFYAVGKFTPFPLFQGYEMEGLSIVNFLIAFTFNVIIVYVRFIKPKHMKRREIKKNNQSQTHTKNHTSESFHTTQNRSEISELKKEFNI
jgi:hypothetical protein